MLQKTIRALTLLTIISAASTNLKATKPQTKQLSNIKTIGQLVNAATAPLDIKAYLKEHAPELEQFAANRTLDAALFSYIAQEEKLVMIKFYSDGCPPCRKMKPIVHEVAQQFSDSLVVINIELSPSTQHLLKAFGARGIPTLVFFKNGKKVEQFSGARSKESLINTIEKLQA